MNNLKIKHELRQILTLNITANGSGNGYEEVEMPSKSGPSEAATVESQTNSGIIENGKKKQKRSVAPDAHLNEERRLDEQNPS